MTPQHRSTGLDNPQRLVWVAVIAATAALLTGSLRVEPLTTAVLFVAGAALISVVVVLAGNRFRSTIRH